MLQIIGGIALFLLGMSMLTQGLKEIAGQSLKRWLNKLIKGHFSAIFTGIMMTLLVQSSTATTVLTIGFVSAGLITFIQSIGVIIGANIGSTSTGLLISVVGFKISLQTLSLPIIAIGVLITYIAPIAIKKIGNACIGFGLLFLGIDLLQQGMSDAQNFISFTSFNDKHLGGFLLLILIGIIMTVIMQASSAAMATTLAALFTETINFNQAALLVIGQNIGTTATALIAAIGASVAAKRTAYTHLLFNVITALIICLGFPLFVQLAQWMSFGGNEPFALALFHVNFSVIGMLIFLPFIQPFANFLQRLIPDKVNTLTNKLDEGLLQHSAAAIEVSAMTMKEILIEITALKLQLLNEKAFNQQMSDKLRMIEQAIEELRLYINEIAPNTKQEREKLITLLHCIDHAVRLGKVLQEPLKFDAMKHHAAFIEKWIVHLEHTRQTLHNKVSLSSLSNELQDYSSMMADARKIKRNEYIERTVSNDAEIHLAVSKIEALLWLDRLIFHFWRSIARLEEYELLD